MGKTKSLIKYLCVKRSFVMLITLVIIIVAVVFAFLAYKGSLRRSDSQLPTGVAGEYTCADPICECHFLNMWGSNECGECENCYVFIHHTSHHQGAEGHVAPDSLQIKALL